jgi:type VI secretion system protein ImpH
MASGDGSGPRDLTHLARLVADPQAHHIFVALRAIEASFPDAPRLGASKRPREDRVRLGQEAELAFPPSTIRSFRPPEADRPGVLVNRFFGMFGPHGPLPLHLTEYARERQINFRDPTLVAFVNMLTHRFMGLLYRAWTTGQPAVDFDRGPGGRVSGRVAALAGLHGAAFRDRDAMPDVAKRHFAGHLSAGPKHADGLASILSAFFAARVEVQEFVGSWLELEPGDRWQLGAPAGLGQATSIGTRVWTRAAKFRIRIGPLSLADYRRLLPGGGSLARLTAIVRGYAGDALDWDVNLVLRAAEVPQARLGGDTRLGQTSWLGARRGAGDADDLYLAPRLGRG